MMYNVYILTPPLVKLLNWTHRFELLCRAEL